jgi:hypothetical protein
MKKVGKVPHVHPLFHFHEGIEPKAFPMFMHCSIGPIHHLCHVLDPPTFYSLVEKSSYTSINQMLMSMKNKKNRSPPYPNFNPSIKG